MKPRRIQPKPVVELEAVTLRLPTHHLQKVDQYARFLAGSSDRAYVVTEAVTLALELDSSFHKHLEVRVGVRGGGGAASRRPSGLRAFRLHHRLASERDPLA